MSLPDYDLYDKNLQHLFYLELKRQIDEIDKIENKKEKNRKISKLKLEVYRSINIAKARAKKKNLISKNINFIFYIRKLIKYICNKIANNFNYIINLNKEKK
jgi:hypothetical protein